MSFLITDAFAGTGVNQAAQTDSTFSLILIAAIFVLFYFMIIRPQNKRGKEQRELLNRLKKGDEIITTGGIIAKIISLDEQYIKISPAEGIEFNMQKGAVNTVLPKGTMKTL